MRVEAFADLRQWQVGMLFGQEGQEGAAEQSQIGQEAGLSAAGAIFPQERVAPPMVAHLDSGPVPPDEPQPLRLAVFVGQGAGKVVAAFGGRSAGFFEGALAAHDNQAAGKGEVGGQGFDGEGVELALLHPPVGAGGVGKKGVAGKASSFWACWKRRG